MTGKPPMARPNLRPWFRARIDWHTNGMLARTQESIPRDVAKIDGDVTSDLIVVTMLDGTVYKWSAGRRSPRKINLTYPPLVPKEIN